MCSAGFLRIILVISVVYSASQCRLGLDWTLERGVDSSQITVIIVITNHFATEHRLVNVSTFYQVTTIISDLGQSAIKMPFNPEPLKEPRGFLRLIQWFIALLAFATCCDFSLKIGFKIDCNNDTVPVHFDTTTSYPFR